MMPKRRIRMEVRATPGQGDGTYEAVVSSYELEYEIGWGWTEQILAGCFEDSIAAHPTIPTFYQHEWSAGPIGSGQPAEAKTNLVVKGRLYLGMGHLVDRVYQAMLDEALEEWSIGFWPEQITWDSDNPQCDAIVSGDLAEASVCVRGANPETGTLELNSRKAWVMGDEPVRRAEVDRLRKRYNVPDLGRRRSDDTGEEAAAGHDHEHTHADGTVHTHQHTHSAGNYEHDASDPEVTHAHDHPDGPGDEGEGEDPGDNESSRARTVRLMSTPLGRRILAAGRAS